MYQRMTKLLLAGVVAALFAVIGTPGAHAQSVKVDVCHIEGNGSFSLINISDKAIPAHLRHGDSLPGEVVPGAPGFVFDDDCLEISDSLCPCDFSATGLAQIGIDGTENEVCYPTGFGNVIIQIYDDEYPTLANVRDDSSCRRLGVNFPGPTQTVQGLSTDQLDDCVIDLLDAAACNF